MDQQSKLDALNVALAALATPEEKIAALSTAYLAAVTEAEKTAADLATSVVNYKALEGDSLAEIGKLSAELSFASTQAGKTTLSVTVGDQRYVTPAGPKYLVDGKEVTAIDLVKDQAACEKLVAVGSGIFTLAQ
jgi:hypothetical protein